MAGVDSDIGPHAGPGSRWDVALSFAGAQRDYVEQVAETLKAWGVRCFYDGDEQIDLWGKYLAEELPAICGEQAAAVVVFVSAEYADRDWTRLERQAVLNGAVRERREYVLPARFDDTSLPGLLSDMVAIDLRSLTPQQFATMIAAKLQQPCQSGDHGPVSPVRFRASDLTPQDRDLVPEHQDFHILGNIAAGEESQPAEQPGHEQIDEAEEHERRG